VVRSLWLLGACFLIGLWLALLLARRIVEPLGELGGDVPPAAPGSSPVREIEALQRRLIASRAAEATARAEAERASQAKDEFMAMLGHELRIPLADF
jgi:signal transduction histidine kinase